MEDQRAKEVHEGGEFLQNQDEVILQEKEGAGYSATDRIIYVVTAPKRGFAGLLGARLGPVIGVSLTMAIIIGVISTVLVFSSDDFIEELRTQEMERVEEQLEDPSLSADQRKRIEEAQEQFDTLSKDFLLLTAVASTVIGTPIIALLVALLVFLIAKILEQGRETQVKYSHSMAVASLGGIVYLLGGLIIAGITRITENPKTASGLAGIIKSDSVFAQTLLGAISLPTIWWIIVIGIGIAAIARTTVGKPTLIFALTFLFLAALWGAIAQAVGGMFGI